MTIILSTLVNRRHPRQRTSHIHFLSHRCSEFNGVENPSFEIMHALAPIPPVKIFQTGRDSGLISQMNLQVAFGLDTKILKCVGLTPIILLHT